MKMHGKKLSVKVLSVLLCLLMCLPAAALSGFAEPDVADGGFTPAENYSYVLTVGGNDSFYLTGLLTLKNVELKVAYRMRNGQDEEIRYETIHVDEIAYQPNTCDIDEHYDENDIHIGDDLVGPFLWEYHGEVPGFPLRAEMTAELGLDPDVYGTKTFNFANKRMPSFIAVSVNLYIPKAINLNVQDNGIKWFPEGYYYDWMSLKKKTKTDTEGVASMEIDGDLLLTDNFVVESTEMADELIAAEGAYPLSLQTPETGDNEKPILDMKSVEPMFGETAEFTATGEEVRYPLEIVSASTPYDQYGVVWTAGLKGSNYSLTSDSKIGQRHIEDGSVSLSEDGVLLLKPDAVDTDGSYPVTLNAVAVGKKISKTVTIQDGTPKWDVTFNTQDGKTDPQSGILQMDVNVPKDGMPDVYDLSATAVPQDESAAAKGGELTYTLTGNSDALKKIESGAVQISQDGMLTVTPEANYRGSYVVTVTASIGTGFAKAQVSISGFTYHYIYINADTGEVVREENVSFNGTPLYAPYSASNTQTHTIWSEWQGDYPLGKPTTGPQERKYYATVMVGEHEYEIVEGAEPSKKASCTTAAQYPAVCKICNREGVVLVGEPLGHIWEPYVLQPATCMETGVLTYKCSRCHTTSYAREEIPKLDHAWDNGTVTKAPTCTAKGVIEYKCSYVSCNATKEETLPALGHTDADGDGVCETCGKKLSAYDTFRCSFCDTYEAGLNAGTAARLYVRLVHPLIHLTDFFVYVLEKMFRMS